MGKSMSELIRQYGNAVPVSELWDANTMSELEFQRAAAAERESRRAMQARQHESAQARAARLLSERTAAAGIPERYRSVPVDRRWQKQLSDGRGIYLWGTLGTGKTWMACAACRGWLADSGESARFASAPSMIADIRAAISDGRGEVAATDRYAKAGLLVVDDVGKEPPTQWGVAKLFEVCDRRYGAMLPTIWTSQCSPARLAEHISGRGDDMTAQAIVSRIVDACSVVEVRGKDRRLAKAAGDGR